LRRIDVEYSTTIGLEVHVELLTQSKLFCSCSTQFGAPPNSQICPVCLGLPGVLPVINRKAIESLILVGCALECKIASLSKFDRKNYFYPDMPKNYQISQYDLPLATEGRLFIAAPGQKEIRIRRIHLEEDTGKSIHRGTIDCSLYTLEDYNRAGVPLLEIVTEPDMKSAEEAFAYLTSLKHIVKWLRVSDCKMEEGSLRCDANISISPTEGVLGTKTEIKNMNSFKAVKEALDYEEKRQIEELAGGGRIIQETRGWDEKKCITIPMRSKEAEHDYRYFPEPDLLPLMVSREWIRDIEHCLPELPEKRKERFIKDYGLLPFDAECITSSREMADFFESANAHHPSPKLICNWLMGDVSKYLNEHSLTLTETRLSPKSLGEMVRMIQKGTISTTIAKSLMEEILATGREPEDIIKEKGWFQISDEEEIQAQVREVLSRNGDAVENIRQGKAKAIGFLVGQVMKAMKGRANPELVNRLMAEELAKPLPLDKKRQ
jgi:aspartyl-tRNA(Asn)/glutamyl-tRNA(Gln) amidotransferase subunit B